MDLSTVHVGVHKHKKKKRVGRGIGSGLGRGRRCGRRLLGLVGGGLAGCGRSRRPVSPPQDPGNSHHDENGERGKEREIVGARLARR